VNIGSTLISLPIAIGIANFYNVLKWNNGLIFNETIRLISVEV